MRFYSEVTKQLYDTQADLVKAEAEYVASTRAKAQKQEDTQAKEAKLVQEAFVKMNEAKNKSEKAYDEMIKAQDEYAKLINEFLNKYDPERNKPEEMFKYVIPEDASDEVFSDFLKSSLARLIGGLSWLI